MALLDPDLPHFWGCRVRCVLIPFLHLAKADLNGDTTNIKSLKQLYEEYWLPIEDCSATSKFISDHLNQIVTSVGQLEYGVVDCT